MPKVSTETTEAPAKAPRKRAVRRVVTSSDAPVRRARSVSAASRETAVSTAPRKAPARVISSEPKVRTSKKKLYIVLSTMVFIAGTATWIGVSDAGQIDVTARINENKEKAAAAAQNQSQNDSQNDSQNNDTQSIVVPVQDTPPVVEAINLSGRGVGTADVVQPVPEVLPEVATTTEATSTQVTTESTEEPPAEGEPEVTPAE